MPAMKLLKAAWAAWKKFGEGMSLVVNTSLLAVVYVIAITPIALIRKIFVKKRKHEKTFWKDFVQEDGPQEVRRQF